MKEEIEFKINKIFLKRSGIDFSENPELQTELLFGERIAMPARELVYVYVDLEKTLGIEIPEKQIIGKRFDTYRHVVECVEELIPN